MWSRVGMMVLYVTVISGLIMWVVPPALRTLAVPARDLVGTVAALILLPEYLVTTARRKRGKTPLPVAYDFGDVIGWAAGLIQRLVEGALVGVSRGVATIPPSIVVMGSAIGVTGFLVGSR